MESRVSEGATKANYAPIPSQSTSAKNQRKKVSHETFVPTNVPVLYLSKGGRPMYPLCRSRQTMLTTSIANRERRLLLCAIREG
jgi:hypothetical protein